MFKCALLLLVLLLPVDHIWAAEIRRLDRPGQATLITVSGSLGNEDVERFRAALAGVGTGTVLLNSEGGSLYAGIEIGRTIRMRGLSTLVSPGVGECASACAFAWVAGTPRMLERGAKLGFHAAYILENGKPLVTGSGNALVGAYLRDLGLSDAAIFFATDARPESMRWLSESDVSRLGMSVSYLESDTEALSKYADRLPTEPAAGDPDNWAVPRGKVPLPELLGDQAPNTTVVRKATKLSELFRRSDQNVLWQDAYLYEEQIGRSPLSIPGKVSWRVDRDSGDPVIEAKVIVDERQFELRVRFGLNREASLPASHLWEISVIRNGQLGSMIAQVQRIAFKNTEQDRGNSLIAVPAKIRSDFHLLAMNDDADALKTNTDLILNRDWIDIPMSLDSSRRILLTFRKGPEAASLFRQAFADWQN